MPQTDLDIDHLRGWIGRTEIVEDLVTPRLDREFRAMLGLAAAPEALGPTPLGLHWCLAPPAAPTSGLGPDGHPARGGFLPPVPLPRRMWAGGRLEIAAPLQIGDRVMRRSVIQDVTLKSGRTGALCFVTVEHDYSTPRGLALRERQDIVYRDAAGASSPARSPADAMTAPAPDLRRDIVADPVLLFRYSALTFNGHRIHYDQPYARQSEGYDGLVVHGPLQATLLLQFAAGLRGGAAPCNFSYRGLQPLLGPCSFSLNAVEQSHGDMQLWTALRTTACMTASAGFV